MPIGRAFDCDGFDEQPLKDLSEAAGGSEFGVPVAGVLDGALLRAKIHEGEAKALSVAFRPFEIVEQAPMMIGADVGAEEHGPAERVQIAAHELDAAVIGDATVLIGSVEVRAAVLGNFEERAFVLASDPHQELVEAVGPDFPGEIGEWAFVSVEIVDAGDVFP